MKVDSRPDAPEHMTDDASASAIEKSPVLLEVAAILLLLLSTFLSFLSGAKDSKSIAELLGSGSAPAIITLVVLGFSRLLGKARTRRSVATISFWTLLITLFGTCGALVAPSTHRPTAQPSLLQADKTRPVLMNRPDGPVLCQESLGLLLPLKTSALQPAPELDEKIASISEKEGLAGWAYRESGDLVIVMGARGLDSEEGLRNFVGGFSKTVAASPGVVKTGEQIEWHGDTGTVTLAVKAPNGTRMEMRCITSPNGNLGCIQTFGADPARLEPLRTRLTVTDAGCR